MTTTSSNTQSRGCSTVPQNGLVPEASRFGVYHEASTRELDAITARVGQGERIDRDSRDWMLEQVDFIIETIGDDAVHLEDETRSNLLQLLLAIANLNEQIRRLESFHL